MAEEYRFFNHIEGDRQYNADEFAEYFRQVLTSGILNGGTNLQVYCNGTDRYARIKPGVAWIEGYFYKNTTELPLELAPADGTYDRIDRIVLRLDRNPENRYIRAFVKTGTPGMNPVAPELTREGLVYEISLAQILIVHNTSVVAADKVTDERLDVSVCGLVNSLIQVDTTEMQAQFDAFMETLEGQGYIPASEKGAPGGVAEQDALVSLSQAHAAHLADNAVHGATSDNIANRIVLRDASGNFSAGTITATLNGSADKVDGIHFRIYNGVLQYNDGTGWKNVANTVTVQRGYTLLVIGLTSVNVTISTVDVSKSFVSFGGVKVGDNSVRELPSVRLTSPTTLAIERNSAFGAVTVAWEVTQIA
jgi:hypothetical protein